MPFTKVVEQCKIYNFGIQMFAHFSSKILRKTRLNSARLSWVGTLALQSARAGVAVAAPRSAGSAHRGRSLVRRSMRRSRNRHATALLCQSARAARPRRAAQLTAAPPYTACAHARRLQSRPGRRLAGARPPTSPAVQARPPARRSKASSGRRRPPCPPAGPLPVACTHTNRFLVTPRASPATSPTLSGAQLAGFWPAAPPPWSRDHIARPKLCPGCFVQTKGMVVRLPIVPGFSLQKRFLPL
jgi:hypothetical protein